MQPPRRYSPRLEEAPLDDTELRCQRWLWPVPGTQAHAGLIAFAGRYREGSEGKMDALFIRWRIEELCDRNLFPAIEGLVVDLRDMEYAWGDDLGVEPRCRDLGGRVRVVVRPEQVEALKFPIGEALLRTDPEGAFGEMVDLVRAISR